MKFFRLITLDVMGTIIDVSAPVGVSYAETAAKYGINVSPHVITKNFGKVWNDMKLKHPNYGLRTGLGWEQWWKLLIHETLVNSTVEKLDCKTLNVVSNNLIKSYSQPDKWNCLDGALDFLKYCDDKEVPLALLSNFDDRLENLLQKMNIKKYFRFIVNSYAVGVEKPDPKIFAITENIAKDFDDLKDIRKNEILHIGDLPDFDYLPAKHAGWRAYLVTKNPNKILDKYPDINKKDIFRNFHEIKQSFECL